MVADLTSPEASERARGLGALAAAYWKPVYTYLRLRWNRTHEDAADLTQEFFARAVEKELIARFDPSKARLRTYLRLCVDGLVANEIKAASRQKRGGGVRLLSLDFENVRREVESDASRAATSPEELFEREWVRSVFALAVERLEVSCEKSGKADRFRLFAAHDLERDGTRPPYADLALRFGLTVVDVTNGLASARRDFRRLVLDVLKEQTASDVEFKREARALLGLEIPS